MENEEILYDDVAMENAHSLLISANNKLIKAKEYYKSDKLSGSMLINEAEDFSNDVIEGINKASQALTKIPVAGNPSSIFRTTGEEEANQIILTTNIMIDAANEEWINEYEAGLKKDLEDCDEVVKLFSEDVSEKEKMLDEFLMPLDGEEDILAKYRIEYGESDYAYATPEEYARYLEIHRPIDPTKCLDENGEFSQEIYDKKLAERKKDIADYTEKFNAAFYEKYGITYTDFSRDLNSSKEILASAKSEKYTLRQQLGEIPYLRIMITDGYKNFGFDKYGSWSSSPNGNEPWYLVLCSNGYSDLFYEEDGKIKSYLNEDEEKMLFYNIIMRNKESNGGTEYLKAIQDRINQRIGEKAAKEAYSGCLNANGEVDMDLFNTIVFAGSGFGDGMSLFLEGIGNVCSSDGIISDTQYKQMFLLGYLNEAGNTDAKVLSAIYQNGSTIGNMAIPIMISILTKKPIVGTIAMGVSAGGNAKNQALIDGYSVGAAWLYGICSGFSEVTLGYFLGKIPGLSKLSGFTLGNLFSEGFEEFSQEFFDAGLRAMIFGEEIDLDSVGDDAVKSFVMGALVAAEFNGANTFAVKFKGRHVEIPFSEIKEFCDTHPKVSIGDAVIEVTKETKPKLDFYLRMNVDGYKVEGMNQNILHTICALNENPLSPEARTLVVDIMKSHETEFIQLFTSEGHYSEQEAREKYNGFITKIDSQGTFDNRLFKVCELASKFTDKNSELLHIPADIFAIRQSMAEHFEKKGMDWFTMCNAFADYNHKTGGICSYANASNIICEQLLLLQFEEHFGFKKYVNFGGKKIYNPILLADLVFETNKEGNCATPNFVCKNGYWELIKGKLNSNSLGRSTLAIDMPKFNQYLNSKGLIATEVAKQAAISESPYDSSITGIPQTKDGKFDTSADYLKFGVEAALRKNYSIGFDIVISDGHPGILILKEIRTGKILDFSGKNHAITVIGLGEEGFIVNTYGTEWILPYNSVVEVRDTSTGKRWGSSVGYTILKISEIN